MNNFLEYALKYVELGWKIFPLAPGQKIPITSHGVKDATDSVKQIQQWWERWPTANIGVACGEASGIYVIDVDVSADGTVNGIESLKEFSELPVTVKQLTPRGGFHGFFKTNIAPANRNSFRPGIDIRGTGYYVVLAPSVHPNGGIYAWGSDCDPWTICLTEYPDFMRPVTRAPWAVQTIHPGGDAAPTAQPYSNDTTRRASLYLAQCDIAVQGCGGHDKLLWASGAMTHGCGLSESQSYDLLTREYNPNCVPPWNLADPKDEKDFRRKITESLKRPPDKPRLWILNDPAYAPVDISGIDVRSMLDTTRHQVPDSVISVCKKPSLAESNFITELQYLTRPTGLLGEICSWINLTALKEQPFLSLACTLAFMGTLFGRKIKDTLGSRTNLYCMGIAPSSAGKAHAMNQIRRLCEASGCTDLLGGDDIASDSAIEDRISRIESTLFMWDEIGHLLAHIKSGVSKHHAQVVSLLMRLYSAAGNVYKGREYAENENQRTIIQPCCCIYGTSTPERFTCGVSANELQDGWLSRCLVFCSLFSPLKTRGLKESEVPKKIIEQVRAWYNRKTDPETNGHSIDQFVTTCGMKKPPEQLIVPTAPEAEQIFINFDNEAIEYGKGRPLLACIWAKGEENARRIALIVAAGESFDNPIITPAIADYSCRLIRVLLQDFESIIIPEIVDGVIEKNKRRIISIIKTSQEGKTKREITRASPWADKRTRDNIFSDLIEAGEIVAAETKDKSGLRYWTAENYQKYLIQE